MSQSFHDAANYLASSPALRKVSNDVKLELYGLFKYVTVAFSPNTSRPGLLDFAGRAKWDAWAAAGKKYGTAHAPDAEARYIQLAQELGWSESITIPAEPIAPTQVNTVEDGDDIWDPPDYQKKGDGGMGTVMSSIASEDIVVKDEPPLHTLTVGSKTDELREYLDTYPMADLNVVDEFGYTALHLACDRGYPEIVRLLVERGVNISMKDPDGFTAVELAEEAGHTDIISILRGQ